MPPNGSGLSHVKQGFNAFDSGGHSGQNREHNFHPVASLLYGATLYYLNLDQKSTLSSFAIATSDGGLYIKATITYFLH